VIFLAVLFALPAAVAVWGETYSSPDGMIHAGANYFSLPAPPESILPSVVFQGLPIQGKLAFWCRLTQSWHVYPTDMSVVDWHMGYRLEADREYRITFSGQPPDQEMSTCLPIPGLAFISQPFDHKLRWRDFRLSLKTTPEVKISAAEAASLGWIEPYLIEGAPDSGTRITFDGAGGADIFVRPWKGYWVTSKRPDLMIYWPSSISDVKRRQDGSPAALNESLVAAVFPGSFYIEADDRSSGLRVNMPNHGLGIGMRVDVTGMIGTNADGERYIEAGTSAGNGTGGPRPVWLPVKALGGADWAYDPTTGAGQRGVLNGRGANTIGMLVTVSGSFRYLDASTFEVDDGSGAVAKCVVPGGVGVNPNWRFVVVTGVSACERTGDDLIRIVRVRSAADIVPYL
jgi:hypothetical protein